MSESYGTENQIQYGQYSPYYINGLGISNGSTLASLLNVAPGTCLDSTGTFQLTLNSTLTLNSAINGLNGLDTGAIAASTVYAVYVVWDPVSNQPAGAMISTNLSTPLIPFGYNAFLLIGYVTTDSSKNFLKGYWSDGNSSTRTFTYDARQATSITAGNATSYTNVNLITLVPNQANTPVFIYYSYVPATAGNALNLQPGNATGSAVAITGQVATIHNTGNTTVLAQPVSITSVISPVINYEVANSSDAVAIDVAGYTWFV